MRDVIKHLGIVTPKKGRADAATPTTHYNVVTTRPILFVMRWVPSSGLSIKFSFLKFKHFRPFKASGTQAVPVTVMDLELLEGCFGDLVQL